MDKKDREGLQELTEEEVELISGGTHAINDLGKVCEIKTVDFKSFAKYGISPALGKAPLLDVMSVLKKADKLEDQF